MSTPTARVDLRPDHWAIVRNALRQHVPDREVLVFGSRAAGNAKEYSDLDLAIMGDEPLSLRVVSALDEALGESDLPFKVDIVEWARIDDGFRRIVRGHGVVVRGVDGLSNTTGSVRGSPPRPRSSGIAGGWPTLSLRSAGVTLFDCEHRTPPAQESGYPYVGIPQVKDGRIDLAGVRRISSEHFDDWTRKSKPQPLDVVLSRRCNPGTTAFVPKGLEFALGQNLVLLRSNGTRVFQPFLRWLVRGPQWWEQVGKYLNVGAVFDSLKCADIPQFQLSIPPLSEQRAIAHILGTLDDKIELSTRMNETLEAMARALFKSWFVDFDPVRAKMEGRDTGLPQDFADLFPDRLVDSEMGEMPEGWQVSEIGKEVNAVGGSTPSTKEPSYWHRGHRYWATPKDLAKLWSPVLLETSRKITDAGLQRISSGTLPVGTVLLSSRAPIGYLAIAEVPTAVNQGFIAMKCKQRLPNLYVLFWCYENLGYIRGIAGGSTFAEISKKAFRTVPVLVPSEGILGMYDHLSRPSYNRLVANMREDATLSALRDTLLPKLISGKIRVAKAERLVGAGT